MENKEAKPIKPYLMDAVLEYCRDNGCSPYMMVAVDDYCVLPREYVRDNMIVFDLSDEAVNQLSITSDAVQFQARFSGEVENVYVPLNRVAAVTPLEYQEFALRFEVTPTEKASQTENSDGEAAPVRRPTRVK